MKTNKIYFSSNIINIYFSEDMKLSAKQRAWLHENKIYKGKGSNHYFFASNSMAPEQYITIAIKLYVRQFKSSIIYEEFVRKLFFGVMDLYNLRSDEEVKFIYDTMKKAFAE